MQLISILLQRQNHHNSQPAGCPLPLRYHPPQPSTWPSPTSKPLSLILQSSHWNGPLLHSLQHEDLHLRPWPPPLFPSQGLPPLALPSHHQHHQLLSVLWPCTTPTQARRCHPRTEKTWSWPRHPQQLPAYLQPPLPVESPRESCCIPAQVPPQSPQSLWTLPIQLPLKTQHRNRPAENHEWPTSICWLWPPHHPHPPRPQRRLRHHQPLYPHLASPVLPWNNWHCPLLVHLISLRPTSIHLHK